MKRKEVVENCRPVNSQVIFERASEQTPGHIPGDVVLVVKSDPHAVFTRSQNDLSMVLSISLKQALLGFKKEVSLVHPNSLFSWLTSAHVIACMHFQIRHLDGHTVTIANEAVSQPGQVINIQGEGMPLHGVPSEFGNLKVELKINMPDKLTDAQRRMIEKNFY